MLAFHAPTDGLLLSGDDATSIGEVLGDVHDVGAGAVFAGHELLFELGMNPLAHIEHPVDGALVSESSLHSGSEHPVASVPGVLVGGDMTIHDTLRVGLCIMDRNETSFPTYD